MRSNIIAVSIGIFLLFAVGCDSNAPDPDAGEQELISDIILDLIDQADQTSISARAVFDEAGVIQRLDTLVIKAGATYTGSIDFRNDFEGEVITDEIRDEGEFHQILYTFGAAAASRLTISVDDSDDNGNPLGLVYTLEDTGTGEGEGTLAVQLRHYENDASLPDDKINDDGSSEIPGIVENDAIVTFPVLITL